MNRLKPLTEHEGIKLTAVTTTLDIDASREKVWEVLSQYGNVSSFHFGVEKSYAGESSNDAACLGAERTCLVRDGKTEITLVEKITEYTEGHCYRYQVFEWKNFPMKMMFFGFSIEENKNGSTTLSLTQNYRLKPGFITGLMKWKIRKMQRRILLGYKHFIETGEANLPEQDILAKAKYRSITFATD